MNRRTAVFALEIALVVGYVVAFGVFSGQSRDFIYVRDNERAVAAARAVDPTLPLAIEFGTTGIGRSLLSIGWWRPEGDERDGVWSKGRAHLVVPVGAAASTAIRISIEGEPFLIEGHETVNLALSADGIPVGDWSFDLGAQPPAMEGEIPASVVGDGLVELRLDVDSAAVREHYTGIDDDRKLGFYLRRITVTLGAANELAGEEGFEPSIP